MTNESFLSIFAGSSFIQAHVKSFTTHDTTSGNRLYVVFKAVDGSVLGFWSHANHRTLRNLRIGDIVLLKRNTNGYLSLASQPAFYANRIGIFALLTRLWRLL